jgi:hypothetical protein
MSEKTKETTATATPATDAPAIKFGFAVLVDVEGNVFVERTKDAFALPIERDASLLEVRRYTSEILMDLQAQSAAEYVTLRLSAAAKTTAGDEATPSA